MRQRLRAVGPLRGTVRVPGDKSISHRALICNALAEGEARVRGFLDGDDCRRTLAILEQLGVGVTRAPGPGGGGDLLVRSPGRAALRTTDAVLDCGNSGTSMRLLAGLLAGLDGRSVLDGDASLRRRPMARVLRPLAEMGATVAGDGPDMRAPITVEGGALRPFDGRMTVPSAQVKSAILLAALAADGPSAIEEIAPTRDHTEIMLGAMGAAIDIDTGDSGGRSVRLDPAAPLRPVDVDVPGDPSAAAFWLVAAAITPGSDVTLPGVGVNPTRTGVIDVLRAMGARITESNPRRAGGEPVADLRVRHGPLRGATIEGDVVPRAIDELPVIAVAAAVADGPSEIRGAEELRVKESDRIATTAGLLRAFGAGVDERPDGLRIHGGAHLRGAQVDAGGDHRLAMAAAVAALAAGPAGEAVSLLDGAEAVAVSYPGFWADLARLAGPRALT